MAESTIASAPVAANPALVVVCVSQFVLQLDFSIVNVALPVIRNELDFSPAGLQWIITGYALTFGSLLLFGGRASDALGQRRMLTLGLALFGLASLACGLAASPLLLIVARTVQGAGGALISPAALSTLTALFPDGPGRLRALGLWQATTAAGGTTGIIAGGALVQYIGWRAIFLVNIPIVIALIVLVPITLPRLRRQRQRASLEVGPSLLVTGVLALLILALSNAETTGFADLWSISPLCLALILAVAFAATQKRSKEPLIPRGLFMSMQRRGALLAMLITGAVLASYVYMASLYLQSVLGLGPFATGLALVPATVTIVLFSSLIARLVVTRIGVRNTTMIGILFVGVGQYWFSFLSENGSYAQNVLPAILSTAVGIGLAAPAIAAAVTADVSPGAQGIAASLLTTSTQIGSAIGLAVLATIAATRTSAAGGSLSAGFALAFAVSAALMVVVLIVVGLTFSKVHPQGKPA